MKKHISSYFLIINLMTVLGFVEPIKAQPTLTQADAVKLTEKTVLMTDREVYCVNDDVLFSAFNISSVPIRKAVWSSVLYVEIVTPEGESLAKGKFLYTENGTSGSLKIPSWILTGNYYLRAYTHWMRDYSPYSYFYKVVKIINPFRTELLKPSGALIVPESDIASPVKQANDIFLKSEKKTYQKREIVNLEIHANKPEKNYEKLTVSVVRAGTENQLALDLKGMQNLTFSNEFIPETRGLSISGKVVSEPDSVPLPYTLVALTIFKQHVESRHILTNEKGQFFIDLSDLSGHYDTFLSVKQNNENKTPVILVDNDFSTQKLELPYIPLDQSSAKRNLYQTLSINSQLQTLFAEQKKEKADRSFSSDSALYGSPDFILKLDDYIPMSTIKDYIYELIPQVGVRHQGERQIMKVLGAHADLDIYDPLVMIDMVPVFEVDRILAIQPKKLERIEVVTTPYIRGSIIFGGIISFFSKKGDLGGIDLPSAGRFINYTMLEKRNATDITVKPTNSHIPDMRNCLFWRPSIDILADNPIKLSFSTGDSDGEYIILVRSIDKEGHPVIASSKILIR